MSDEEVFKAWVAERINNKQFEGHWNHTHKRTLGRTGRETWIDGKTGFADITVTKHGNGIDQHYSAKIVMPVTSKYKRKTFKGIGNEHNEEGWETTYKYHVTYNRGITMNRLVGESFTDHSTAAGHDAVVWSQEEVRNDVFANLTNS